MQSVRFSFFLILTLFVVPAVSADRLEQPALKQTALDNVLLLSIERAGERLVAAGEQGSIIFSDDGGVTWLQAKVPISTLITSMHFFDNQRGWAVGHDGVVLTTRDAGENWKLQLDGVAINQLRVDAISKALERVTVLNAKAGSEDVEDLESLEYALEDAELALQEGPSTPLLDVLFLDAMKGYAVGAYGLFLETQDGGGHWSYIGHLLPNPDGFHINKIYQARSGSLMLLGEAGLLMQSEDAGLHWTVVDLPYSGSLFSIAEKDGLYLMGLRGNIFYKPDHQGLEGGDANNANWNKIPLSISSTINDSVFVNDVLYLVGQDGVLLRQEAKGFETFSKRGLRSYSSVTSSGSHLVMVGEGGVSRIAVNEAEK